MILLSGSVVGAFLSRVGLILASGCDGSPEVARVGAGSTGRPGSWMVGTRVAGVSRKPFVVA